MRKSWRQFFNLLPIKSEFDIVFEEFLARTFGSDQLLKFVPPKVDWDNFFPATEKKLYRSTQNWLQHVRAQVGDATDKLGENWLAKEIKTNQRELDQIGFQAFVRNHFKFSTALENVTNDQEDCIYFKINHAFWEDVYRLFASADELKCIYDRSLYRNREGTLDSYFLAALVELTREFGQLNEMGIRFGNVNYAINLLNGANSNEKIVDKFDELNPLAQQIGPIAAVGCASFFHQLFGRVRIRLHDGYFPKYSYNNGTLRTEMTKLASISDQIVFVVPPHLQNIRLDVSAGLEQQVMHVSRKRAAASWVASTYAISAPIVKRMQAGEDVLVISQCGYFTALLGLFLAKAAKELVHNGARLRFFDLGQVPDIANVAESGAWIRNYGPGEDMLFYIADKN